MRFLYESPIEYLFLFFIFICGHRVIVAMAKELLSLCLFFIFLNSYLKNRDNGSLIICEES